ncbi:MAG: hypothetical protein ABJA80_06795 [bacterium]
MAILHVLQDAKARIPDSAMSLHALRLQEGDDLRRLLARGIVHSAGNNPGTSYAPISSDVFTPTLSLRVTIALLVIVIAMVVAAFAKLA